MKSFVNMVDTQYNTKVKCIRNDNGPEFMLTGFFLQIKGLDIRHRVL
jgi:hypothetical protein